MASGDQVSHEEDGLDEETAARSVGSLSHDFPSNDHNGVEAFFQGTGRGIHSESSEWKGLPIMTDISSTLLSGSLQSDLI